MSLEAFRGVLLNSIDTKPLDAGAEPVQKPANEKRNYSFLRALNAASRGDWSGAGFEVEMSAEVATNATSNHRVFMSLTLLGDSVSSRLEPMLLVDFSHPQSSLPMSG